MFPKSALSMPKAFNIWTFYNIQSPKKAKGDEETKVETGTNSVAFYRVHRKHFQGQFSTFHYCEDTLVRVSSPWDRQSQ